MIMIYLMFTHFHTLNTHSELREHTETKRNEHQEPQTNRGESNQQHVFILATLNCFYSGHAQVVLF